MLSIVLSRRDFREFDQIVSLYAQEHGKVDCVARGVKKTKSKNSPFLEIGTLIEAEVIQAKEMSQLLQAQPVNIFPGLRRDFTKLTLSQWTLRVFEQLVGGVEKDERLFRFLFRWLTWLNTAPIVNDVLVYGFMLQLLQLLGFAPATQACGGCSGNIETQAGGWFCTEMGGLIDENCRKKNVNPMWLDPLEREALVYLNHNSWENLMGYTGNVSPKLRRVLYEFLVFHSEKNILEWKSL